MICQVIDVILFHIIFIIISSTNILLEEVIYLVVVTAHFELPPDIKRE